MSERDDYREQMLRMLDVSNSVVKLLRESEDKVRSIIESSLDAIVTINDEGCITEWNPRAERMFGWSRDEVLGQRLSQVIIPHRYRERHEQGLKRYLATGEALVFGKRLEVAALQKDGVEFPVELAILPLESEFVGFMKDLRQSVPATPIDDVLSDLLTEQ